MRRLLLASVGVAALVLCVQGPARAQMDVIDHTSIAQLLNQLTQMQQTYQATMGIFGSLLRTVNPNGMMPGLIGNQPMPGVPNISSMMVGGGNFGSLAGTANQFLSANTAYRPTSFGAGDFQASMLSRSGNSLAGIAAMAQQSIQSIQQHISGLASIQGSLSTVTSQADVSAIQGRLQAEQANLMAQGVQAQSLQTMLAAQQQAYALQGQQMSRQAADGRLAYFGGGTAPSPVTLASAGTLSMGMLTAPAGGGNVPAVPPAIIPTQQQAVNMPAGAPAPIQEPDLTNVVGGDGSEKNSAGPVTDIPVFSHDTLTE